MQPLLAGVIVVLLGAARASADQGRPLATCDPARIDRESYRLATEAQALNVLQPRYRWWDGFNIGKHEWDLADLNETALYLAERARSIDERNLLAHGLLARSYVVLGEDAGKATDAWTKTLDGGGAVTWTATLYDVDPYSFFVLAFDRRALRIYRFEALAGTVEKRIKGLPVFPPATNERFWRAMAGCVDPAASFEAEIPWSDVDEIKSGNWVTWIKFRTPVRVGSDRGKSRTIRELKVNLHGQTGDLTFYYNIGRHGEAENLRGIAVGPTDFQRRVQHVLATMFDSAGRIRLPQKGRGAGW
jgi:hypothetical protein